MLLVSYTNMGLCLYISTQVQGYVALLAPVLEKEQLFFVTYALTFKTISQ